MRITQWGEYGILCASFLAEREKENVKTVGATEIAKAQGIALEYAQQILQRLRRGGIIASVRGPQGGYKLARTPREISLKDILLAAEGDTFEVICDTKPIGLPRCGTGECGLGPIWQKLKAHVDTFLSGYTLEDVVCNTSAGASCSEQLHRLSA